MRRFEYIKGNSAKYWEIGRKGAVITQHFGRISQAATVKQKTYEDYMSAEQDFDKLIRQKLRQGYVEVHEASEAPEQLASRALRLVTLDDAEVLELSGDATAYLMWRMIEIGVVDRFAEAPRVDRWEHRAARRVRLSDLPEPGDAKYDEWFAEFLRLSERERSQRPESFEIGAYKFLTRSHWIVTTEETERLYNRTKSVNPRRRNESQRQRRYVDEWLEFHEKALGVGYRVELASE